MARIFADRVKETTTTASTSGTLTLDGNDLGYQSFSDVMVAGDTCFYCEEGGASGQWETGIATFVNATTLTKNEVITSSFSNQIVDFEAGPKTIFITQTSRAFSDISIKQLQHVMSANELININCTTVLGVHEAFGSNASSLVPIMTSNTAPSGTVTASGYYTGAEPWKAFGSGSWVRGSSGPHWIRYDFGSQQTIERYTIENNGHSGYWAIPIRWTLSGSNDNSNWTLLHDTGLMEVTVFDVQHILSFTLPTPALYRYFKIAILNEHTVTGGASEIIQWGLYQTATSRLLTPVTDYTVVRATTQRGPQQNTITRIKAGTAIEHLIDYI